jgi:hypothetical protein
VRSAGKSPGHETQARGMYHNTMDRGGAAVSKRSGRQISSHPSEKAINASEGTYRARYVMNAA